MVMTQQTNTQYVAHEFVRQYYTILHSDPTQLHRFYTKESRLTHGVSPNAKSDEQAVCGQEAIYEKISQLNFKKCFSKIRSVDSHPTLAGGVVIQVNGELSNSGMPYRKFMQTFVLGQQEPKKYHVVNDIFRYQDETFEDTENEETIDGTVESENGYQAYDGMQTTETNDANNDQQDSQLIQTSEPIKETDDNTYAFNGHVHEDETQNMNGDVESEDVAEEVEPEQPSNVVDEPYEEEYHQEDVVEPEPVVEEAAPEPVKPKEIAKEKPQSDGPPKQVSWASLAKKNTSSTVTAASPPQQKQAPPKQAPAPQQPLQKKREEAPPVKEETVKEQPRRRTPAPDTHQIFIGNLPSSITEKDVRDNFSEFGNIVEVRLNPKNFGFIAFDSPDAPTMILNKPKSIVINGNTINLEVKRSGGAGRERGADRGTGGGFRRDRGSDKDRRGERGEGKSDFNTRNSGNKNSGQFRNSGGNGRGSFGGGAQGGKRNEDGYNNRNDSGNNKGQKEQSKTRDEFKTQNRR